MTPLCITCTNFMLVKIRFGGEYDSKRACLVKPAIFDNLKVGHFHDDRNRDAPNVASCTHYNKKKEVDNDKKIL